MCYLHTLVTDPDELGDSCQIKQSLRIEILFKTEEKKVIFTEKYIKSTKVLPNILIFRSRCTSLQDGLILLEIFLSDMDSRVVETVYGPVS